MGTRRQQWQAGNTNGREARSKLKARSPACSLTAVRLQLAGS